MRIETTPEAIAFLVNAGNADAVAYEFQRKQSVIEGLLRENAALQAEVERLKAETVKQIEAAMPPIEAYIAKLEAENQRLRKAGDAMAAIIRPPAHGPSEWDGEYDAWFAAKGVQS